MSSEYDETVRMMIRHEDAQVNSRVTWHLTFQGFLFASFGFAWKDARSMVFLLCFLGIAMASITVFDLIGAQKATFDLLKWWKTHTPPDYQGPHVIGGDYDTEKMRDVWGRFRFLSPQAYFSLVLGVAWVIIFFVCLYLRLTAK